MKIGISGPISTESIAPFLSCDTTALPVGHGGAPLLGTLIGELLVRGHDVSAYTTSPNLPLNLQQPVIAHGNRFKIYYCPMRKHSVRLNGRHLGRIVDFFQLERRYLEQAIRMDNPDVVHAHWAYEFALAAIASGKPHVVTCHDAPQEILKYMPNLYRLGRYFMARRAMHTAAALTTVSPYMRDALTPLVGGRTIAVIPNPIPPTLTQRPFDLNRSLSTTQPQVAMVSNGWDKRKNPQAGLMAFAKLRITVADASLRLYGSGFGQGEVAHLWAKAQGIADGMVFVGKLPYAQLLEEIAKAKIFLHPSLEESFGMVLAEAMALGVPVVAGQSSGAVPWVVGDSGVLVDVNNPDAIAQALIQLLADTAQWQTMRAAASHTSKARFAATVVATAYEAQYQQQLTGRTL